MILAYARRYCSSRLDRYEADAPYDEGYKIGTIILATIMMWCLDFSINTSKHLASGRGCFQF